MEHDPRVMEILARLADLHWELEKNLDDSLSALISLDEVKASEAATETFKRCQALVKNRKARAETLLMNLRCDPQGDWPI